MNWARDRAAWLTLSVALGLGLLSPPCAGDDPEGPNPEGWSTRGAPHPDIEDLLAEADLVPRPVTPLLMARLATTPRLIARLVLEDHVLPYLSTGRPGEWRARYERARLYGYFLALQVADSFPRAELEEMIWKARDTVECHMGIWYARRAWPDEPRYKTAERVNTTLQADRDLAVEIMRRKIPLDEEILAEIRGQAKGVPTKASLERLGKLWHRLDDSGREYLERNRARLCPLLAQMVQSRGIPQHSRQPPAK